MKTSDQFKASMGNVKAMLTKFKKADLEELASINNYTSEEYYELNRWLRAGSKDNDEYLAAFKRVLSSALKLMKRHKGTVYRGGDLPGDVIQEYKRHLKNKKPIAHLAFTSTTKEAGKEFHGNTKFVITSINGRSIEKLSRFTTELEVLFDAGTKFSVTAIEENGRKTIIYLAESKN